MLKTGDEVFMKRYGFPVEGSQHNAQKLKIAEKR
jgi:hypothetical protein